MMVIWPERDDISTQFKRTIPVPDDTCTMEKIISPSIRGANYSGDTTNVRSEACPV